MLLKKVLSIILVVLFLVVEGCIIIASPSNITEPTTSGWRAIVLVSIVGFIFVAFIVSLVIMELRHK